MNFHVLSIDRKYVNIRKFDYLLHKLRIGNTKQLVKFCA